MKKKSPKHKYVKIRYIQGIDKFAESFLLLSLGIVLGLAICVIKYFSASAAISTVWRVAAIVMFTIVFSLLLFIYLYISHQRRELQKENKYIKKHGTLVIGEIISLERTEARTTDGKENFTFSYNVQYRSPDDDSLIVIRTPTVIKDNMLVKEKDLPIKVVVYVYEKRTFVESLIDPPYKLMQLRKLFRYLLALFSVCSFVCLSILNETKGVNAVLARGIIALCFCASIYGLFFAYLFKDRF